MSKEKNNMLYITILLVVSALFLISTSVNYVQAARMESFGSTVTSFITNNKSIVGGVTSGDIHWTMGVNAGNFTARLLFNTTGTSTWTTATLTGVSGNTTCFSNSSCFRPGAGTGGDSFKATWTLPTNLALSGAYALRLEVNGSSNRTHELRIDTAIPGINTITPSDKSVITDSTPTISFDATENISSATLYIGGQMVQMSRTDADTFSATVPNQLATSSYSYNIEARDYASTPNFFKPTYYLTLQGPQVGNVAQLDADNALASLQSEKAPAELKKTAIGAGSGLVLGAVAGSIVPGLGTLIGGGVGFVVGGIIGIVV